MYYLQTKPIINYDDSTKTLAYLDIRLSDDHYRNITGCKTVRNIVEENFIIEYVENINHDVRIYHVILKNGIHMKIFLYDLQGCFIRAYATVDDILDLINGLHHHIPHNTLVTPTVYIPQLNNINYFKDNINDPFYFISSIDKSLPNILNYGSGEFIIVDNDISDNMKYTTLVKDFSNKDSMSGNQCIHRVDNYYQFCKYLKLSKYQIITYYRLNGNYFLYTK